MKKLKNQFSWSFSRQRLFKECKRKYYLNHYGMWNGWQNDADERTKKIYLLKKMTNRYMLSGGAVHDIIKIIIMNFEVDAIMEFPQAEELLHEKLRKAYTQSKKQDWKKNPKDNCNLSEHYFNENISKEQWIQFRENASACLKGFYEFTDYEIIKNSDSNTWFESPKFDTFEFRGVKIFSEPDFAYKKNDIIIIYDWKTGKISPDDKIQLLIYALYAKNKWGADFSKIQLSDVYLKDSASVYVHDVEEKIPEVESMMQSSIKEMQSMLIDVESNTANEVDFKMTDDTNKCRFCSFKEICHPDNWEEL